METLQTNTWKKRRLFQITQIRTKLKKITQIHTRISQKNHHTNCIFSRTHHNNRLQYQNSPTKAFRNMKNLRP
jgi:hypothetical protein